MHDFDPFEDETAEGTVFRDVVMLALVGFDALVIMLLPHLTRPAPRPRTT